MHSATWINFTLIVDQKCNLRLLFSIVVNNDVWQRGAKKKTRAFEQTIRERLSRYYT